MPKSLHEQAHDAEKFGFVLQTIDAVIIAAFAVAWLARTARSKWASRRRGEPMREAERRPA